MSGFTPPGDCPTCGAYVDTGSSSCEECGSCPQTGWSEESLYDGLDLPNYENDSNGRGESSDVARIVGVILLLAAVIYVFVFR